MSERVFLWKTVLDLKMDTGARLERAPFSFPDAFAAPLCRGSFKEHPPGETWRLGESSVQLVVLPDAQIDW